MRRENDKAVQAARETELTPELLRNAISLFSHEMRVPVVAFRAVIERMKYECSKNGCAFKHDSRPDFRD
jgi:signal transduction histidine kinase